MARFNGVNAGESANTSSSDLFRLLQEELAGSTGTVAAPASATGPTTGLAPAGKAGGGGEAGVADAAQTGGTAPLLDYLLGR